MTTTESDVRTDHQIKEPDNENFRNFNRKTRKPIVGGIAGLAVVAASVGGYFLVDHLRDESRRKAANAKLEGTLEERGANDAGIRVLVRGEQDKLRVNCDDVLDNDARTGRYIGFKLASTDGKIEISLPPREALYDADGQELEPAGEESFDLSTDNNMSAFFQSEKLGEWCVALTTEK